MPPPLGRQNSIISIEYNAKSRHAPLPIVTWAESLNTQTNKIWAKTPLFFGLHLILGRKTY